MTFIIYLRNQPKPFESLWLGTTKGLFLWSLVQGQWSVKEMLYKEIADNARRTTHDAQRMTTDRAGPESSLMSTWWSSELKTENFTKCMSGIYCVFLLNLWFVYNISGDTIHCAIIPNVLDKSFRSYPHSKSMVCLVAVTSAS